MIGIIVAAVCVFLVVAAGIGWFFWSKRKRRPDETSKDNVLGEQVEVEDTSPAKPNELQADANGPVEVEGDGTYFGPNKSKYGAEVEGSPGPDKDRAEAPGAYGGAEVEGSRGGYEMQGSDVPEVGAGRREVFELPAGDLLTVGTGEERRSPQTPRSPYTEGSPGAPTSPRSLTSSANTGSQRDSERRRERDRRRERGRAADNNERRWSWKRSRVDGEAF